MHVEVLEWQVREGTLEMSLIQAKNKCWESEPTMAPTSLNANYPKNKISKETFHFTSKQFFFWYSVLQGLQISQENIGLIMLKTIKMLGTEHKGVQYLCSHIQNICDSVVVLIDFTLSSPYLLNIVSVIIVFNPGN